MRKNVLENLPYYDFFSNPRPEILIPAILGLLAESISAYLNKRHLIKQEKNKYLNFIRSNSQPVDDFLQKIALYKAYTGAKYFLLIEGFLFAIILSSKIIDYVRSISSILGNTFLNEIFPNLILYMNQTYDNPIDLYVDFFVLVSYLNYLSVAFTIFVFIWILFLESKDYALPKLAKNKSITPWSIVIYYNYWVFLGAIIGIDIVIIFFTLYAIYFFGPDDKNFSISYISNTITNISMKIPTEKTIDIIAPYAYGLVASVGTLLINIHYIKIFPIFFKALIYEFYSLKFPYILIKSGSGKVSGQLYDFLDDDILMLNENKVLKAVPWSQIRTMEIKNKEEQKEIQVIKNEAIHPR